MRIKDFNPFKGLIEEKKSGSNSRKAPGLSLFADTLSHQCATEDSYAQEIETLRKEIDFAGDTLSREPTIANFKKYKELLSRLVKKISSEAYRLEKIGGTPVNPRYYETITVINAEAEQLYNLIVAQQQSNLKIVEKVMGIKGLVIDLIT